MRANYRASKAKFDEAKAAYQQSVLTAFAEVSNALITRQKLAEVYIYDGQAVVALTDWAVKPARKVVPGYKGLDGSTLVLAWLAEFAWLASSLPMANS